MLCPETKRGLVRAEAELLSGDQLEALWRPEIGSYASPTAGAAALAALGLAGARRELTLKLDEVADCLRPFEFGYYRHLGFLKDSEAGLLPPLRLDVGGKTLELEYVGSGYFGSVYKLGAGEGASYALKVFYQRALEHGFSGPWNEAALGMYVTAQNVSDMPHLCLANPRKGWLLSEFVDERFESAHPQGPSWKALGLISYDPHKDGENILAGKWGCPYRVDYGHLASRARQNGTPQNDAVAKLVQSAGADGAITKGAFLDLFVNDASARRYLMPHLGRLHESDRFEALSEMCSFPEADFFPLQDYMEKGVLPASRTIDLFDLLMKNKDPAVRGQAIFDISKISREEVNHLGNAWYTRPEFTPFMIYLGQKRFESDYLPGAGFL